MALDLKDLKVLLVDDDPAMLRLLSKRLELAGYPVTTAADGRAALAAIEDDCPDILITNWDMPHVDGIELCRRVREMELPHYVYILFLTAKSSQDELAQGLAVGANDFLTKPVHTTELLARMGSGSRVVELERRLSQAARRDSLTGLLTQRSFYETMEKEWARSGRYYLPLSCVMLDVDYFKRVNDVLGHPTGDAVLKAVASLLSESCRASDTACRYGGEEFCVLLPETPECKAVQWAERVCKTLRETVIGQGEKTTTVTASFGVAQRREDTQTPSDLVDRADQALLCAKQSGRDRVVCYEDLCNREEVDLNGNDKYGGLFGGILAWHVMTPMVFCLREEETLGNAIEFFLRSRLNSAPVVNDRDLLVGMVSEKDLMAAMVSPDCWEQTVHTVMKPNVICYEEQTPIRTIYEFLCRVSIRRVVIAQNGRPTGTISRATLLRWFRNLLISKGLAADCDMACAPALLDAQRSKQRLAETARELAHQAAQLERQFGDHPDDLGPIVIGGATQMQGLVNDLLAFARFADPQQAGALMLSSAMPD